jgi:hypothetical protein
MYSFRYEPPYLLTACSLSQVSHACQYQLIATQRADHFSWASFPVSTRVRHFNRKSRFEPRPRVQSIWEKGNYCLGMNQML